MLVFVLVLKSEDSPTLTAESTSIRWNSKKKKNNNKKQQQQQQQLEKVHPFWKRLSDNKCARAGYSIGLRSYVVCVDDGRNRIWLVECIYVGVITFEKKISLNETGSLHILVNLKACVV